MAFGRWVVGGLIGGAVGGLIWVLVGYFANYEIGWIAWGIGFLVGLGVRFAAHLGDQEESTGQGIVAAVIAITSILLAKYVVFSLLSNDISTEVREAIGAIQTNDEGIITSMADDIADEMTTAGQTVNWPTGVTHDTAFHKADYPAEIWQQAESKWNQMSEEDKETRRVARRIVADAMLEAATGPSFGSTFSPWDLLWFGLAIVTAFKVGVGSYGSDD